MGTEIDALSPQMDAAASRRRVLAGLGALALAQWLPAAAAVAPKRQIVDVHAHYYPPAVKELGLPGPMNAWSLQSHMDAMAAAGVTRSILSLTTPGVPSIGENGRALVRKSNEFAARTCADHPGRFGFFVCIQPDDIEGSLQEIAYGLDVLKAQGIGLFTSYKDHWLGDPQFDPLFAELERRRAIVYVHPTSAACCSRLIPGIADTIVEYGTDTTRAITSFVYRGAARKFPNVRMIWSHGGGSMPFLIERFDFADRSEAARLQAPQGFRKAAARFFYDIAQASNPVATTALRQVIPVDHILFGSDYPFRTPLEHVQALEAGRVFSREELRGVYFQNAGHALPELLA
ncbi:MAG TPA: amidohydrolase family protein [Steroidobacteraceae bacterium]